MDLCFEKWSFFGDQKSQQCQVMLSGSPVSVQQTRAQLNALWSSANLASYEAAISLRSAVSKLERIRMSGIGPVWAAMRGAKGVAASYVNQKSIAWLAANKAGGAVVGARTAPQPGAVQTTLTHKALNRLHRREQ